MNYSEDLRKRVVKFVIEGNNSRRKTSKVFDIHYNTVKEWVKIFKETGELSPKAIPGKQPTKINLSELYKQVLEHPDWFQDEHAQTFGVKQPAISKALAKLGITRKKNLFYEEQDKSKVEEFKQIIGSIDECVYLDESGIKLSREYAWSSKGHQVFGHTKGKREKNVNIIAALNNSTIIAPLVYEGTMDTDFAYLEEILLPVLEPGQVLIMDNASFHNSEETNVLVEQFGCQLLFLPPYSPQLNPIEHTWAALKRYIKRFRHQFDSLIETIDFIFQNEIISNGIDA